MTEIPKGTWNSPAPCWIPTKNQDGSNAKPLIKCQCGRITGIGLHHVHADGTVTASFYHKRGNVPPEDTKGCEWHVFLKLLDYDCGDFPGIK
jgi:hypothetical protein